MKKSPKRFHRVNRASFLSLSNEFEDQKLIPKITPKKFWSAPCFPKIVCGVQCGGAGPQAAPDILVVAGREIWKYAGKAFKIKILGNLKYNTQKIGKERGSEGVTGCQEL